MKKKILIVLTIASLLVAPIVFVSDTVSYGKITPFNHGEG